jgi:hypothetical protein
MLDDDFNSSVCACSIDSVAQIKNMREVILIFAGLWFDINAIFILIAFRKV